MSYAVSERATDDRSAATVENAEPFEIAKLLKTFGAAKDYKFNSKSAKDRIGSGFECMVWQLTDALRNVDGTASFVVLQVL